MKRSMTAIIVDDEPLSLIYVEKLCLEIPGLEIAGRFREAVSALSFLRRMPVDLVFTDIEMPGMNGIEAVREIRRIRPQTGVIFVTGYEQYALDAFKLDAIAYIMKPCSAAELESAVKRASLLLPEEKKRIEIDTFGQFRIQLDGVPLRLANRKANELLALLVDRQGAVVSMEQATDILWEGRPYDETVKRLYRKAVGYLNQVFHEQNVTFFVSDRGSCHIVPAEIDCDYYRLLAGDREATSLFCGEYMSQYSWAEETVGKIEHLLERQ